MIQAILMVLTATVLLFMGNSLLRLRKQIQGLNSSLEILNRTVNDLTKEHPVLINADLFFSRQLRDINGQLVSMDNQLQGLENKRDNDGGYQHALRILEMGGDREEIISSCHLSSAEADLLMNLQAYRQAIKPK